MELILSAYGAITLILLTVQVLEYIVGRARPAAIERYAVMSFEKLPQTAVKPVTEPTVLYDRAA